MNIHSPIPFDIRQCRTDTRLVVQTTSPVTKFHWRRHITGQRRSQDHVTAHVTLHCEAVRDDDVNAQNWSGSWELAKWIARITDHSIVVELSLAVAFCLSRYLCSLADSYDDKWRCADCGIIIRARWFGSAETWSAADCMLHYGESVNYRDH